MRLFLALNTTSGLTLLAIIGLAAGIGSGALIESSPTVTIPDLRGAVYEPIEWSGSPSFPARPERTTHLV